MIRALSRRNALASLFLVAGFATACAVFAQGPGAPAPAAKEEYAPVSGQAGKDVVWVPSPVETVEKMLDMAKLTSKDFVVDLGSGDGRNIILAAKRGARGLGVEYNPDMVELSKRNAAKEGVSHLVRFVQGDMFEADFSGATVLALFLLPDNLRRLEPKFLKLAPGTRIVANTFGIDGWTPDSEETIGPNCTSWCKVLLYTVPAPVAGTWRAGQDRYEISQAAQSLSGSRVVKGGSRASIDNGKVEGNQVRFTIAGAIYSGTVNGNRIDGTVETKGQKRPWSASRGT